MKLNWKFLALHIFCSVFYLAIDAFATGPGFGGGGGGICVTPDLCATLAEAGVRVSSPKEAYYMPKPGFLSQVNKTLDALPIESYRKEYMTKIVGSGNTFKLLEIESSDKLEELRKAYIDSLKKNQIDIDESKVQLFAFTGQDFDGRLIIFLLPQFFNKLTESQQIKTIIHETNVRTILNGNTRLSYADVLEFDGMIEDLLNKKILISSENFRIDRWEFLISILVNENFELTGPDARYLTSLYNWLYWLKINRSIIFDYNVTCISNHVDCQLDLTAISYNYEIPPAFYRLFNNNKIVGLILPRLAHDFEPIEFDSLIASDIIATCQTLDESKNSGTYFYPYVSNGVDTKLAIVNCMRSQSKWEYKAMKVISRLVL